MYVSFSLSLHNNDDNNDNIINNKNNNNICQHFRSNFMFKKP